MGYSVIFSSKTGNTAKLAMQIKNILGEDNLDFFGITGMNVPISKVVFVGFWTDKGSCDDETAELLENCIDKQIFLFGTAGFGGSEEYFQKIIESAKSHMHESSNLLSSFMCRGKMPAAVRERYEQMQQETPGDDRIKMLIDNFDDAAKHPDDADLQNVAQWAEKCFGSAQDE